MTDTAGTDPATTARTTRPNILLICTDQQRFSALAAYDNPEIHTPHLDRLAGDGVLFENCYVQNPVCGPSRASLMTGRYVHAHGEWANGVALPAHERLFTRELADAGYDCGLVGKLHLAACHSGRTEQRLDDGFRVFRWAHDPYKGSSENAYHRWLKASRPDLYQAALDPDSPVTFDAMPTEAHYSRWIGNETIDYLRSGRDKDAPFCFIANFFDPHHGFGAPKEYLDRYDPDALSRPVTTPGELNGKPEIYTEASEKSYAGHAKGFTEYSADELQQTKAAYYAMVSLVDDEVGRILQALDDEGLTDDTVVIFTSDHGEMLGDHQLMLKGPMMYEEAVRVPLLIRWPGTIPAGRRCADLVQWIDIAPTLFEAAGLATSRAHQGDSLLPVATGTGGWQRDWALCEHRNSSHPYDPPVHTTMLRHDRWKIVVHHGDPATSRRRTGELYDLSADPHELRNLWDHPAHAATRTSLQERLLDVLVATEDRSQEREADW
ncbi:sulfatase-like hydrolase/transferase [Phytoactinopolyspora halotolerans]|uniref:Sulfatase-like hydrolase/transferase n=1 Tax=Phytoactinopolyspora halotolerans TaxID=1981512 RepID=A0A6L9S4J6_9ACTN|nr:sulfatase-like hydrolase/transferase [Phytoactinopolyspora halotolerans]NED99563.1 sulfatase-like hydrolase/transferase [Phytoactinopolyspora halotolerans]